MRKTGLLSFMVIAVLTVSSILGQAKGPDLSQLDSLGMSQLGQVVGIMMRAQPDLPDKALAPFMETPISSVTIKTILDTCLYYSQGVNLFQANFPAKITELCQNLATEIRVRPKIEAEIRSEMEVEIQSRINEAVRDALEKREQFIADSIATVKKWSAERQELVEVISDSTRREFLTVFLSNRPQKQRMQSLKKKTPAEETKELIDIMIAAWEKSGQKTDRDGPNILNHARIEMFRQDLVAEGVAEDAQDGFLLFFNPQEPVSIDSLNAIIKAHEKEIKRLKKSSGKSGDTTDISGDTSSTSDDTSKKETESSEKGPSHWKLIIESVPYPRGVSIGGTMVALILLIVLLFIIRRRHARQRDKEKREVNFPS